MNDTSVAVPLNQIPVNMLASPGNRLQNRLSTLQGASGDRQKAELKKVSQEFEAIFLAHLLKVMRETIEDSRLLEGGFGKSIYTELFDQEVSLSLARRGTLGISNLLYQTLSEQLNSKDGKESGKSTAAGQTVQPVTSPEGRVPDMRDEEISDLQLPVRAPVSSSFGIRRDPFSHEAKFHKGIDLAAPEGTRIVPALQGKVVYAGYMGGYGNTVVVQHSGKLQTRYGHLGSIAVKIGDIVDSQDILGTVGSTGRSTGPHLHFEVTRSGVAVDPAENLSVSFPDTRTRDSKEGV